MFDLKYAYQSNRKLANTFIVIILVLVATLIIAIKVTQPSLADGTKLNTVSSASVDNKNLESQRSVLHGIIKKTYGEKLNGYEIADGELLEDGSWYATTFSKPTDQWSLAEDTYRVILHKANDGSWQIVAGPELIFSYLEYPDIPKPVIFSANNL